jgi:hypothetical protein
MPKLHMKAREQVKKPEWTTQFQAVKNTCNASIESKYLGYLDRDIAISIVDSN